jgi:hypothetical protein
MWVNLIHKTTKIDPNAEHPFTNLPLQYVKSYP